VLLAAADDRARHGGRARLVLALLVVGSEVLDGREDPLGLRALDPARRRARDEERVLAEGLERPPVQRRAHHVDRRREDAVVALQARLVVDSLSVQEGVRRLEGSRHVCPRASGHGAPAAVAPGAPAPSYSAVASTTNHDARRRSDLLIIEDSPCLDFGPTGWQASLAMSNCDVLHRGNAHQAAIT